MWMHQHNIFYTRSFSVVLIFILNIHCDDWMQHSASGEYGGGEGRGTLSIL